MKTRNSVGAVLGLVGLLGCASVPVRSEKPEQIEEISDFAQSTGANYSLSLEDGLSDLANIAIVCGRKKSIIGYDESTLKEIMFNGYGLLGANIGEGFIFYDRGENSYHPDSLITGHDTILVFSPRMVSRIKIHDVAAKLGDKEKSEIETIINRVIENLPTSCEYSLRRT